MKNIADSKSYMEIEGIEFDTEPADKKETCNLCGNSKEQCEQTMPLPLESAIQKFLVGNEE